MSDTSEIILGIDLGTTFSLAAYVDEAGPHVIPDAQGEVRLPSVMAIVPDGAGGSRISIGWEARNHAVENPETTVYSIKRLIGKGLAELQAELPFLAYHVVSGPRETVRVDIGGRAYAPEEISAITLRALKERAEAHLNRPVSKAVVTVPAYFDDAQRQATRDASRAAGLDVVRIVNEPTAAALAYGIGIGERDAANRDSTSDGFGMAARAEQTAAGTRFTLPQPTCDDSPTAAQPDAAHADAQVIAVYDLGGGTFDISVLRIEDGVFQVLSTAGDTHLGGDDFDRTIIEAVQREVREQYGLGIDSPRIRQALRLFAESVKIHLGQREHANLELDLGEGRTYRREITRDEFESWAAPLVDRTIAHCRGALKDAKLTPADIAQIVLVGGSTRIPLVRRRVEEAFGRKPYTALDPDQVVAIGAAMQASILAGGKLDMLLLDVIPLSLGIETMGGAMGKLIVKNTTIPCRAVENFTTFVDGQTAIKINVLQGERELAADCRSLAEFELRGIPPMPAGMPKVEVEFLIDANGILSVSAVETRSGQAASIQVVPNHGLTRDEIARIEADSLKHAKDDVEAHRRIDLINQIEFDASKTEQMLAKFGDNLDPDERQRIEAELAALRVLGAQSQNLDEIYNALHAFGRSTRRLAEIGIRETLKGDAAG